MRGGGTLQKLRHNLFARQHVHHGKIRKLHHQAAQQVGEPGGLVDHEHRQPRHRALQRRRAGSHDRHGAAVEERQRLPRNNVQTHPTHGVFRPLLLQLLPHLRPRRQGNKPDVALFLHDPCRRLQQYRPMSRDFLGPTPRQQGNARAPVCSLSLALLNPPVRQRMPHPLGLEIRCVPGKPLHLKGEYHQQPLKNPLHRSGPARLPRPHLGAHVIHDGRRRVLPVQSFCQPQVEPRIIHQHHHVRLEFGDLRLHLPEKDQELRQILQHIGQPHHRMPRQVKTLLLTRRPQHRPTHSVDLQFGISLLERPHEVGRQPVPAHFPRHHVDGGLIQRGGLHWPIGVICSQIREANCNASNPCVPATRGSVSCRTLSKNSSSWFFRGSPLRTGILSRVILPSSRR